MPVMRRQWIVGLAALVVLFVPIVLAAALKGSHHHTASSGPVVLAREDGNDALALSVTSNAVQVKLFGPQGKGLGGRTVTVAGTATRSCGSGCYVARTSPRGDVSVLVDGRRLSFAVPREAPDGAALLQRATTAFRALHSVTYVERLASSRRDHIVSTFTLEAPDRVEYHIHGGVAGIVIGTKRWDRSGKKWTESASTLLPQPSPVWGSPVTDAHVLSRTPGTIVISFLNPGIPAWFEVRFDAHTLLPRRLDMIAVSHFMHHRYAAFNAPRRIFPPR